MVSAITRVILFSFATRHYPCYGRRNMKTNKFAVAGILGASGFVIGALSVFVTIVSSTGCIGGDCFICDSEYDEVYTCWRSEWDWDPLQFCTTDFETAEYICSFEYGGTYVTEPSCGSDEVGLEEWPTGWPGSEVTYVSGTYYVSEDLVTTVLQDWTYLLNDSSRFQVATGGYYELTGVASGDFWYALGFQSGDKFTTLNGNDLDTLPDVWAAYADVAEPGDTTFVIGYVRSSTPYTKTVVVQ